MIWSYHVMSCPINQPGLIRPYEALISEGGSTLGGVWLISHNRIRGVWGFTKNPSNEKVFWRSFPFRGLLFFILPWMIFPERHAMPQGKIPERCLAIDRWSPSKQKFQRCDSSARKEQAFHHKLIKDFFLGATSYTLQDKRRLWMLVGFPWKEKSWTWITVL